MTKIIRTIEITIISDIDSLQQSINKYVDKMYEFEFGYNSVRITELPVIYSEMILWEQKNIDLISDTDAFSFLKLRERIEKLLYDFGFWYLIQSKQNSKPII